MYLSYIPLPQMCFSIYIVNCSHISVYVMGKKHITCKVVAFLVGISGEEYACFKKDKFSINQYFLYGEKWCLNCHSFSLPKKYNSIIVYKIGS